jgi:predicted  nucleic acid-binding Zn-ribbon protein
MASANDFQIGLDVLIGASSGIVGAVGAYVKLKSRIDLEGAKNNEQEKEIQDLKERKKELAAALHKRIDDQNHTIQDIQKEMSKGHQNLEKNIAQMELRIVREIQNMVDKFVNR